ncbi:tetratricopeptide repeat protein [Patescibacteria group bacterium]|nr:tetratricopeptide repeat protein [Patescibacteria group bacterium]MBU1963956.1 tetratricopeptide repeat protein [Patescibacteria group bacterium]
MKKKNKKQEVEVKLGPSNPDTFNISDKEEKPKTEVDLFGLKDEKDAHPSVRPSGYSGLRSGPPATKKEKQRLDRIKRRQKGREKKRAEALRQAQDKQNNNDKKKSSKRKDNDLAQDAWSTHGEKEERKKLGFFGTIFRKTPRQARDKKKTTPFVPPKPKQEPKREEIPRQAPDKIIEKDVPKEAEPEDINETVGVKPGEKIIYADTVIADKIVTDKMEGNVSAGEVRPALHKRVGNGVKNGIDKGLVTLRIKRDPSKGINIERRDEDEILQFSLYDWLRDLLRSRNFRITIALIVIISVLGMVGGIYYDRQKSFDYVPETPTDYTDLEWKEKVGNDGFSFYSNPLGSFEWKADVYVPDTSFIFVVKDIGKTKMHIRNIEGSLKVPGTATFPSMNNFPIVDGYRTVSGLRELDIEGTVHFTSVLGLDFVSSISFTTIKINGDDAFNIATYHLPAKSKVIKVGDGEYPGGVYEINPQTYFFHNFVYPSIVYFQPGYHTLIQALILYSILLIIIVSVAFFKALSDIPYRISSRYLVISIFACALVMIFFALIFPNPRQITLNFDNRQTQYQTDGIVANDVDLPDYLWWVLGITRSIDAFIVGETTNCEASVLGHYKLTKFAGADFYVIDQYQNTECASLVKTLSPEKTKIVSQEELNQIINQDYGQKIYPPLWLFSFSAKIIVFLSALIIGLCMAFLLWRAFSIRNIKTFLGTGLYGVLIFFGLMGLYIIVGMLAHMPVMYHAKNTLGLMMSNYFMPGVIGGGNIFRTIFAFAGLIFILFLSRKIYTRINPIIIPIVLSVMLLFLFIPYTEYWGKRIALTLTSAEAYQWDYKQDPFNPFDLYKNIRDNNVYNYLVYAFGKEEKGRRLVLLADSLNEEGRYVEAIAIGNRIVEKYQNTPKIKALGYYELGESYYDLVNQEIVLEEFWRSDETITNNYYYNKAIENYTNYLDLDFGYFAERAIFHRAKSYQALADYPKAILSYQEYLLKFPQGEFAKIVKLYLAECYQRTNNHQDAILLFQDFITNYPENSNIDEAKYKLAESYTVLSQYAEAIALYGEIIKYYPKSNFIPLARFKLAYAYEKLHGDTPETIQQFEQLLTDFPTDMGVTENALSRLSIVYPKDLRTYVYEFQAAITRVKTKNFAAAEIAYESLLDQDISKAMRVNIQFRLADIYEITGQKEKAKEKYEEIINNYNGSIASTYAQREQARLNDDKKGVALFDEDIIEYLGKYSLEEHGFKEQVLFTQKEGSVAAKIKEKESEYLQKQTTEENLLYQQELEKKNINAYSISLPSTEQITAPWYKTFVEFMDRSHLSRGMTLYFVGVMILMILLLLTRNFRTLILPFLFFFLSRGIIRIGEQDPFRALSSIPPAISTGLQLIFILLLINVIIFLLFHFDKFKKKMYEIQAFFTEIKKTRQFSWKKLRGLFIK